MHKILRLNFVDGFNGFILYKRKLIYVNVKA